MNERMDQQYWDAIRPAGADPEPPTVPVVRTIQSAEWSTVMVECLTEAGIPGVTEIGGGLAYDVSGEQGETADRTNFEVELFICQKHYPVVTLEKVDPEFLGEAQLAYLYDYWTSKTAPCLRANGLSVTEPPARESFVAGYYFGARWSPFDALYQTQGSYWDYLTYRCPRPPDELVQLPYD